MEINNHVTNNQSVRVKLFPFSHFFLSARAFFSSLLKLHRVSFGHFGGAAAAREKEVNYNLFRAFRQKKSEVKSERRKSCLFDSWVLLTRSQPFFLIKTFFSLLACSFFSVWSSLNDFLPFHRAEEWRERGNEKVNFDFVFNISTWPNISCEVT